MHIFIVIPAYNEEKTIGAVLKELQSKYANIIVVDDGSSDKTGEIAADCGVIALTHIVNRGQGAALQTGIAYALQTGADVIVTFDADGQHDSCDIERLVEPILQGKDEVVLGSRFLNAKIKNQKSKLKLKMQNDRSRKEKLMPFTRVLALQLGLLHQWFFTGLKVTDTHCGMRAFSRKAAEKVTITQDRMAHASEILERLARHRLSFVEVPVTVLYSEYSLKKGQKSFLGGLKILYEFFIGRSL